MASYGLYTHIASNRRRSVALLIGLFLLVYVMVFAGALIAEVLLRVDAPLAYYLRAAWADLVRVLPYATVGTLIWIAIAYKFHQAMIDAVTGAQAVTRRDQPRLYNLLENLCISRGITMPTLKVMESPALNAFATGLNEKQYAVTVTSGLMAALNDQEIEAVLAHELTHIRNGDVRMMVIAVIIAGAVGFFAELVFRLLFSSSWNFGGGSRSSSSSDSDRKGGGAGPAIVIALALIALAWLMSVMIRLALSRSRELLADAGSVELTKNPDSMIWALRKIENRGELPGATSAVMEMCVDNPREGFADLFATHPSVDSRVHALVQYAGGHDPGPLALPEPEAPADANEAQDEDAAPDTDEGPPETPPCPWGRRPAPTDADAPGGPPPKASPWGALTKPFGRRGR
ncbi:MAG: peptidase M48 Ste24p [Xanthobacteraceae bacterium]|nr:MAG: peptidase M48 Ste24p [Xanthobacteraceae bacterium]